MEEKRDQLVFTFQYVSINTRSVASEDLQARIFTFQYVSINTKGHESPP